MAGCGVEGSDADGCGAAHRGVAGVNPAHHVLDAICMWGFATYRMFCEKIAV